MAQVVCAVLDVKASVFGRPVFVQSRGVALRSFSDEVNKPSDDNPLYRHPQDFQLYFLGEFDEVTGRFTCPDRPELLQQGASVKVDA